MLDAPVWTLADAEIDISDAAAEVFDPDNEQGCKAVAYLDVFDHDSSGPDPHRDYPEVAIYRAVGARIAVGDRTFYADRASCDQLGLGHALTICETMASET
jgi:hypothetical protein